MSSKILIVEDSDSLRRLWKLSFELKKCEVHLAENLDEAREYLKENTFDLMLCDFYIGKEVSTDFINNCAERFPESQIALVTGRNVDEVRDQISDSVQIFQKPVELSTLFSLIKE